MGKAENKTEDSSLESINLRLDNMAKYMFKIMKAIETKNSTESPIGPKEIRFPIESFSCPQTILTANNKTVSVDYARFKESFSLTPSPVQSWDEIQLNGFINGSIVDDVQCGDTGTIVGDTTDEMLGKFIGTDSVNQIKTGVSIAANELLKLKNPMCDYDRFSIDNTPVIKIKTPYQWEGDTVLGVLKYRGLLVDAVRFFRTINPNIRTLSPSRPYELINSDVSHVVDIFSEKQFLNIVK